MRFPRELRPRWAGRQRHPCRADLDSASCRIVPLAQSPLGLRLGAEKPALLWAAKPLRFSSPLTDAERRSETRVAATGGRGEVAASWMTLATDPAANGGARALRRGGSSRSGRLGRPSLGYFSWPRKRSSPPAGRDPQPRRRDGTRTFTAAPPPPSAPTRPAGRACPRTPARPRPRWPEPRYSDCSRRTGAPGSAG